MNHVYIRSEKRRGILVGTMAVPEQLPNGAVTIVAMGIIAVDEAWSIVPVGQLVLLVGDLRDYSVVTLEEKYPPIEVPVAPPAASDLVVPRPGMRLVK